MIRAFIVAGSPLVRAGLENILAAQGVEVVGAISSVDLLADYLVEAGAHVVLIDASGEQSETVLASINQLELTSEAAVVLLADHPAPGWLAEAVRAGKRVGLANKEVLVSGGQLVMDAVRASGSELIPIDSEHNGAHQCLRAGHRADVTKLILTASNREGPAGERPPD